MKTFLNFTSAYHSMLEDVYKSPEYESSPRGLKIKERLGYSFRITNIRDRLPYVPHREFSVSYFVAEMLWYLSGNNSTDWISYYSGFWKNISDDGKTANSAYGARIFNLHKYQLLQTSGKEFSDGIPRSKLPDDCRWSQWKYVIDELKNDRDSRRAVIHIRMPQDSIEAKKDVPCTLTLQFFIRDDALHQVASMRSSDLIFGMAYDVPAFTMFQELLAMELGVECGSYTHISNSLHIYERHYEMVEKILHDLLFTEVSSRAISMHPMPTLPPLDLLNKYENMIRKADDLNSLSTVVTMFDIDCDEKMDSYWRDWVLILARHRAQKLDLSKFVDKLSQTISFSGYKSFNK